ncbi:MAG: hypothetical protein K8R21_05920 [Leptospira sp.]|nr:hypothetical protein [Leptospira sp.]
MLYSLALTLVCILSLGLAVKTGRTEVSFTSIVSSLRNSINNISESHSVLILIFFISFLFLPLFWGLSFFLRTDGNVVIVVVFIIWSYNWVKYIFYVDSN